MGKMWILIQPPQVVGVSHPTTTTPPQTLRVVVVQAGSLKQPILFDICPYLILMKIRPNEA